MTSLTVRPGQAQGTVPAPPSKSITHRALFASLLAGGGTITNPLISRDTRATLDAVHGFGARTVATRREIALRGARLRPADIHADNSGTTLRLATALAALADGTSTLDGDASLNQRPMGPLVDALNQLGARARSQDDGTPPVHVDGPLQGGHATLPGDVSSQFTSALLMAATKAPAPVTITVTGDQASRPYVDLTLDVLETIGARIEEDPEGTFHIEPSPLTPQPLPVPGDYSSAAFPLIAGALTSGPVQVTNLDPSPTQGDARIVEILERFGARVDRSGDAVTVTGGSLQGARVDLSTTPDLFPALAALAAASEGETVLEGAPHLREKESDRIQAMVDGLTALGVDAHGTEDGARIEGGVVQAGRVDAAEDHRVQMAFAVLGLTAQGPVEIVGDPGVHETSYPGFLDAMHQLGARLEARVEASA